ncbi:hypothetical protein ACVW19_000715 [Streptomyces sp. TE5632]
MLCASNHWDTDLVLAANSRHVLQEILAERAPLGR